MNITRVIIDNFKSIDHIELDFDKVDNSYTKIFVGINESGKSNILEALSYFEEPQQEVSFDLFCNQKREDAEYCDLYFKLGFENGEEAALKKIIKESVTNQTEIEFSISNIEKNVYLSNDSQKFEKLYNYSIKLQSSGLYIKKFKSSGEIIISVVEETQKTEEYELLNEENFIKYFRETITSFIAEHEPYVSVWKPSKEYLLCDADLNTFKEKPNSNKPLYNIFKLCGYNDKQTITDIVSKVSNPRNRSKLKSKLNDALNTYVSTIWDNKIDLIIEITETGAFSLLIKDKGKANEHDRFSITERSQGAQQFLSMILSLSIETNNRERKNELILIDEPEVHLHPSGIRNLSNELLKIGQANYVFLATHSPFMIDKKNKERHFIVKKNKNAITEITRIQKSDNIIDDEVLNEAFGINVYSDLLNPHSILVEGASDKVILQKAFALLGHEDFGIANGHGSNIDTLASKMNYDNISILVITDDDQDGRKYKENILKIGGAYNYDTVYTIRDIEGSIIDQGTIEDTLGVEYIKSQFLKFYKSSFDEELTGITLSNDKPIITQIIAILKRKKINSQWNMDAFKKQLSDDFNPTKTALKKDFPLLHNLALKILGKLK